MTYEEKVYCRAAFRRDAFCCRDRLTRAGRSAHAAPCHPEDGYIDRLRPYNGGDMVYLLGDAAIADQDVVAALPERSDCRAVLYCAQFIPSYEYSASVNMRFRLSEVYVADQMGSTLFVTLGHRYRGY